MKRVECPACAHVGPLSIEDSFSLIGRHEQHDVYRCVRCGAALVVRTGATGDRIAEPLPAARWEAMNRAWATWERAQAVEWMHPETVLNRAAEPLRHQASSDDFLPGLNDLLTAAKGAVLELWEREKGTASDDASAGRPPHRHPMGEEAIAEVAALVTRALWIFVLWQRFDLYRDPSRRVELERAFPLDERDRETVASLASMPRRQQASGAPDVAPTGFAVQALAWLLRDRGIAGKAEVVSAWHAALETAHRLMWDRIESSVY